MSREHFGPYQDDSEYYIGQTVEELFAARDFGDAHLIVAPGTSDRDGTTLYKWAHVLIDRFPADATTWVDYPAAVGPLVDGYGDASSLKDRWHAHRYDESKLLAYANTMTALEHTDGPVVMFGYSQSSDAITEAAADAVDFGIKPADDIELIVWAHPGLPGGIKDVISREHKIAAKALKHVFKADMNRLWVPHPGIRTTSITMTGDAITSFPSVLPNPVRFAREFREGFFGVHSGVGERCADKFPELRICGASRENMVQHLVLDTAA